MTTNEKLTALACAARALNAANVTWAVGASALMYLEGAAETFHDLDLLIAGGQAEPAGTALRSAGAVRQPLPPPGGPYQTAQFSEYRLDNVDFDLLCGFAVRRDGEVYHYVFNETKIVRMAEVEGVPVPLSPLADWYVLYQLMPGRGDRAEAIAHALLTRPPEGWAPRLEARLKEPLPADVRGRVRTLIDSAGR